jgi:hypothetical protein
VLAMVSEALANLYEGPVAKTVSMNANLGRAVDGKLRSR